MHYGFDGPIMVQLCYLYIFICAVAFSATLANQIELMQDMRNEKRELWKLGILADMNLTEEQSLDLYKKTEELEPRLEVITNIKKYL